MFIPSQITNNLPRNINTNASEEDVKLISMDGVRLSVRSAVSGTVYSIKGQYY